MSYIKDTFSRFRQFLIDSVDAIKYVLNQLTLNNLKNLLKSEYSDIRLKLSDLKGTNWDLAQYHFVAGNHNDAIMRFKILQKSNYRLLETYYFLGRIYLEKNNKPMAKECLDAYLSSQNKQYQAEAEYCVSILHNAEINTIPSSIIVNKRNRIALNLERSNLDTAILNRYYAVINLLKVVINHNEKILEIGCNIGILGRIIRDTFDSKIQYFEGTEIALKALEVASMMHIGTKALYDKTTFIKDVSCIAESNNTYSMVLMTDILTVYSDLPHLFLKLFIILDNPGTAVVGARVIKNQICKNIEFIYPIEEFRYSHSYIIETAVSCGFQLRESYDIGDGFEVYVFKKI